MDIAGATHVGRVRSNNEDSYRISEINDKHLFIIADGMGGHHAGEVASLLAVTNIRERFRDQNFDINEFLEESFSSSHNIIKKAAENDEQKQGMGTTVDVAIISGEELKIAHVGDSRVYILSGGELIQLTEDHSYVQELVNKGILTREEAIAHPSKNLITKVVGCDEYSPPDIIERTVVKGDVLLMCTDGLTNFATDEEIKVILSRALKSQQMANALIKLANTKGGRDNITVIVAKN